MRKLFFILFSFFIVSCSKEDTSVIENEFNSTDSEIYSNIHPKLSNTSARGVNNISGFNWADGRDNFVDGWVIPSGLTASDSYSIIQSKANTILSEFQSVGANTVRLPINPSSVLESWWERYKGAIDMAVSKDMMVILAYWEADSSRDGRVDNTTQFYDMWEVVVNDYGSNPYVFFEVFNEPHGYNTSELISLYNNWLDNYSNVPQNRVLLGGTGYSENVSSIGSSFPNCLFSQHLYAWWGNHTNPSSWETELANRIGAYASRTIVTEFGAPMTTGKNYTASVNGDYEIAFIQGLTNYCRNSNVASVYWPGLRDGDSYSLYTYDGSMHLTNASGLQRIQYGWGAGSDGYYRIVNRNSGKVLDVDRESTANGGNIIQWPSNGGQNQQWELISSGNYYRIVNRKSGKDLDVNGGSTQNNANIIQWESNGGDNQLWELIENGGGYYRIINKKSVKALDVSGGTVADGGNVIQWTWNGGNNQQWELIQL